MSVTQANTRHIEAAGLELEIRTDAQGKPSLYFPFMAISDVHLGTKHSRAKRTSHMLQHTEAGTLKLLGDIPDGLHMLEKETWNFAPWHRQVVAHFLRKQAQGTDVTAFAGNHDVALRGTDLSFDEKKFRYREYEGISFSEIPDGEKVWHRKLVGKRLFGIPIVDEEVYTAPKGRRFKLVHGDIYDDVVFGQNKEFWYGIGDTLHTPLANFDTWTHELPKFRGISIASTAKWATKSIINRFMGVNDEITRVIDGDTSIDGHIAGHSHMGGFEKTPRGKSNFNTGCCTEHAQVLVHDRHGNFALITWHRDRLDYTTENGKEHTIYFKALGLNSFLCDPAEVEDRHTQKADRVIRLMYREWSPKERRREAQEAREQGLVPPPIPLPNPAAEARKEFRKALKILSLQGLPKGAALSPSFPFRSPETYQPPTLGIA